MTARTLYSYGLIAGMSMRDMKREKPGFILDMYKKRMAYDDEQHGIRRDKGVAF